MKIVRNGEFCASCGNGVVFWGWNPAGKWLETGLPIGWVSPCGTRHHRV
jgi:hypothetical protein